MNGKRWCVPCSGTGELDRDGDGHFKVECKSCGSLGIDPSVAVKPTVFVGETRDKAFVWRLRNSGMGRIWAESVRIQSYDGEPWAFDSGAYSYFLRGEKLNEKKYAKRLAEAYRHSEAHSAPVLNVVPDIVGKGMRSAEYSLSWLPKMPKGWKNYLAVQDGMTVYEVREVAEFFDGIFLGGTDKFKQTAMTWAIFAHRGFPRDGYPTKCGPMPFHYGRAGTLKKIRAARQVLADSLDSSFPLWTRDRFSDFVRMTQEPDPQTDMFAAALEGK